MPKEEVQGFEEAGKLETQFLDQELEVGLERVSLALVQRKNLLELFPRVSTLAEICETFVLVTCSDFSSLSHSPWYKEFTNKGNSVKSPEQFLKLENIPKDKNVVIWMVDNTDRLPELLEHWRTNALRHKFLSECYTVTKVSSRKKATPW